MPLGHYGRVIVSMAYIAVVVGQYGNRTLCRCARLKKITKVMGVFKKVSKVESEIESILYSI